MLMAVCMLTTPPTKKDMKSTIPIELIPTFSISNNNCFQKTLNFSGLLITLFIMIKYCPRCLSSFNI